MLLLIELQSTETDTMFYTRNLLYQILILLLGIINASFLVCILIIYNTEDNSMNSFCALCFIFSPVVGFIVSAIGLTTERRLVKYGSPEHSLFHTFVLGYIIVFISCLLQGMIICSLIGTTKNDDSAYEGLLNREIGNY